MKKILIPATLILSISIFANAATTQPDSFCPSAQSLKKNPKAGNWTAETKEGKWKSYDMSFATNITQFVGAQWAGENIGQVTCIYNSEQRFTMQGKPTVQATLPVLLVYHALTFQPNSGKWKHVKRGIYNCYSENQSDCPFKINLKPAVQNIYEEAESLKNSSDTNNLTAPPPPPPTE